MDNFNLCNYFGRCFECSFNDRCSDDNAVKFAQLFECMSREQQDVLLGLSDDLGLAFNHSMCQVYEDEIQKEWKQRLDLEFRKGFNGHQLKFRFDYEN